MDEFLILSATGLGGLLFYNRTPFDPEQSIDGFEVRVTDRNLSAATGVYAFHDHPAHVFDKMALRWSGWDEELKWCSLENELEIRCSHDGLGHVYITVELKQSFMPDAWRVTATVMAEAGQLEDIARRANAFFGRI